MNSEQHPHMSFRDPPSVDSPILCGIIYKLSNAISELRGQNSLLENLLGFSISELSIVNSQMIYCGEDSIKKVIEYLREVCSAFERIDFRILVGDINESISLLESILVDSENLYLSPSEEEMAMSVAKDANLDYMMKYQKRVLDIRAKCPSCSHEFVVSSFNVSRSPYGYRCPNCNQSISY